MASHYYRTISLALLPQPSPSSPSNISNASTIAEVSIVPESKQLCLLTGKANCTKKDGIVLDEPLSKVSSTSIPISSPSSRYSQTKASSLPSSPTKSSRNLAELRAEIQMMRDASFGMNSQLQSGYFSNTIAR